LISFDLLIVFSVNFSLSLSVTQLFVPKLSDLTPTITYICFVYCTDRALWNETVQWPT
jgi:hypothetical protein